MVSMPATTRTQSPTPPAPARRARILLLGLVVATVGLGACGGGGGSGADLVVYSGAEPNVLEPLVTKFEKANNVDIELRNGSSPTLALQIDTEGDKSPADVFLSQSPGAMGYLASKDRLLALPQSILDRVPERFRSAEGRWVALSGRVRSLVYNSNEVRKADLPDSVFDLTGAEYEGKVGVAPNNGSFIDFISAMRSLVGDEKAQDFLDGLKANGARTYPNNIAVVAAVARGEVDYGLVNHYYNEQAKAEDPNQPTENYVFPNADPGALILTSALAILDTGADNEALARTFIEFLLSPESQQYLTETTREYPVLPGVKPALDDLPALADIPSPDVDLTSLGGAFDKTRTMIADSGLASS